MISSTRAFKPYISIAFCSYTPLPFKNDFFITTRDLSEQSIALSLFQNFKRYSKKSGEDPPAPRVPYITYDSLKKVLGGPDQILVDVRSPKEVKAGKIPTSINIPLANIQEDLSLKPQVFRKKFGVKKPTKKDLIICHCYNGKRSTKACAILEELGFQHVLNYRGGWKEWKMIKDNKKSS